jgi:hypothetical protein
VVELMSEPEIIVRMLLEVQALLIAWAVYPHIFGRRKSPKN